jgi:hypothetical protein
LLFGASLGKADGRSFLQNLYLPQIEKKYMESQSQRQHIKSSVADPDLHGFSMILVGWTGKNDPQKRKKMLSISFLPQWKII